MTTNPYFQYFNYGQEQNLIEDLLIENIKIHGLNFKYLPKTIVNQDFLLGEDPLGKFNLAVDIEMFIKDTGGFTGDGDIFGHHGLEIRDQITLTMARKRWNEIKTEKVQLEHGWSLQLESANTYAWGNSCAVLIEEGTANGYTITSPRPMEGDLIFFPLNNKLYEIKFVEHESIFYQNGKLYTYDLTCEMFERDNRLDTGNTVIDQIETTYSQDILLNQTLLETGDTVLLEDGGYLVLEYRLENTVPSANNEVIHRESLSVIDFSEVNPFVISD